jgi:thiosulfate dehydrogenase [quinone] large subunit
LILGLATRFWAVVGMAQTVAISLSILNGPNEWSWAYYMMFAGHALLWATAAGRAFGLDAILRPGWAVADGRVPALLRRAS